MDPDFKTVVDALSGSACHTESLIRLVAKTGNSALQSQMLFHVANEGYRPPAKRMRVEGPRETGRCPEHQQHRPDEQQPDEQHEQAVQQAVQPDERQAVQPDERQAVQPDERQAVRQAVQHHQQQAEQQQQAGQQQPGEQPADEGSEAAPDLSLDDFEKDLEYLLVNGADLGDDPQEAEEADASPRSDGSMQDYLEKDHKIQRTFARFYDAYGSRDVEQPVLKSFIEQGSDIIKAGSCSKLFRPPKGFSISLFVRRGKVVGLAREWIEALERMRKA